MPSLLRPTNAIKLDKLAQIALTAIPASSKFEADLLRELSAIYVTSKEMANAPINAQIPIACAPRKAPSPKKIAQVAPSDAPDETPKI